MTSFINLIADTNNEIEINCKSIPNEAKKIYYVGIYMFKKLNVETLIKKLKHSRINNPNLTRNLIVEKLKNSEIDFTIETNTLNLSLICPLMQSRIKIPGRSILCKYFLFCFVVFFLNIFYFI